MMAAVFMLTTADEQVAEYSAADFRRLFEASTCDVFRQHHLVDVPDVADIILFVGSTYPDHRDVRSHALVRKWREKCFLFHSDDYVIPFLPGVYVNVGKRWHTDRVATGPYLQMAYWDHVRYVPSLQQCKYLFSFVGSTRSHRVRKQLMRLQHPRGYLEDTSAPITSRSKRDAFFMVPYRREDKDHYGAVISATKFVLCPRGYACSTWRLFETLKAGRVPVIISDQWVPPVGPDWDEFSIRVMERDAATIPELLESYEARADAMAIGARAAWQDWFSKEAMFHRIVEWCLMLKGGSRPSKISELTPYVQLLRPFYVRHVLLPRLKHLIRPI